MSLRAEAWSFFGEFRFVFMTGALLFLPTWGLMGANQSGGICSSGLCASQGTPWGFITGVYLYDGPLNVMMFILLASMFVSLTGWEPHGERKRRSLCLLVTSFTAAFLANLIWLILTPDAVSGDQLIVHFTYGQSGVVYGVLGTFVAALMTPAFPKGYTVASIRAHFSSRSSMSNLMLGIAGLGCMLLISMWAPELLFGSAQIFNVFVHKVAFTISFILSLSFFLLGRMQIGMPKFLQDYHLTQSG